MAEKPITKSEPNQTAAGTLKVGWFLGLVAATLWAVAAGAYYLERTDLAGFALGLGLVAFLAMLVSGWILRKPRKQESPFPSSLDAVLSDERNQIQAARRLDGNEAAETLSIYVGLALSGGGIRSATFNLGLLQALAELHLLSRIDYLSTVSGGGYIGSWLMQWVRNAQPKAADANLAAMLYVAWADDELSDTDKGVLEEACARPSANPPSVTDPRPDPGVRKGWLDIAAAAKDREGRANIAAYARRIVNAHRNALEGLATDSKEFREKKAALEKKQSALAEVEVALGLTASDETDSKERQKMQSALAEVELALGLPGGKAPDANLAAMLYVASADDELSDTDRSVLEAACARPSTAPPKFPDMPLGPGVRDRWFSIATAAEDRKGKLLGQHRRAGIAACARRIVNAHRNALEKFAASDQTDSNELEDKKSALKKKQSALAEVELALGLPGGKAPDANLAAMLYVASADDELSDTDRSVLEAACARPSTAPPKFPDMPLGPGVRDRWFSIATAAEDRKGKLLGQHRRAGIAACARRIVNAHRNALEKFAASDQTDSNELEDKKSALKKKQDALEEKKSALAEIELALALRGIDKIQHALADEASVAAPEPRPVSHLREFSNYLTPQVGLLTADTWTTVATYVRNFSINLVMITATVSLVLMLPRLIRRLTASVDAAIGRLPDHWELIGLSVAEHWSLGLAGLSATLAVFAIAVSLRQAALDEDHGQPRWRSQGAIQRFIVLPLCFSALCAAHWLGTDTGDASTWKRWAAVTAAAYALPWLLFGWFSAFWGRGEEGKAKDRWTLANSVLALVGLAVGAAGGLAMFQLKQMGGALGSWSLLTIGPPAIMSTFTLSAVLLIGLAGRRLDDYLREWLARVGAWVSIYSLGWLALVGLATYGPVMLAAAEGGGRWLLASGWLAASIGGVLAGNARQQGAKSRWHGPMIRFAPWVFILGLILSLTWALDAGLSRQSNETLTAWEEFNAAARLRETSEVLDYQRDGSRLRLERSEQPSADWLGNLRTKHEQLLDLQLGITRSEQGEHVQPGSWIPLLAWLLGLALVAGLFGWRVDINEFSMHNYYRNRLVRAFLGASNPNRPSKTQPFTGMARSDDTPLGVDEVLRPYHLVNTAINLVGGSRLAWQQRKAASFILSPLYSGFEMPPSDSTYNREAAFRKTSGLEDLTLGTSMAISGAAASPNMGFRSTPALTLLLTVFNVRLGWWLGNPKGPAWHRLTPNFALAPLLSELFGLTSLDSNYVYLSDGGHFENLGIYELVRRRCRFIIASDVGADPELAFEDLGNAVRKCRSDFGAQIDIDIGPLKPNASGISGQHCVVGEITYAAETDGGLGDQGWLLYIKSSVTGDEPEDVLQYKMANDAFPHQSTADQFFDEPQFESYRELGRHVGHKVFESASKDLPKRFKNWDSLFVDLRQRWYASSALVEKSFSKHGQALDRLFERLGRDRNLEFLDSQIYHELGSTLSRSPRDMPTKRRERRAGFYFCSSLLQLMENVYLDLDLDDEQEHPDNRGWVRLFERWAQVPMVIATWAVTADNYGSRFRSFCERRLALPLSTVAIGDPLDAATVDKLAKGLRTTGGEIVKRGDNPKITWHELMAVAPGLKFPIGKVVLWNTEKAEGKKAASWLLYYELDVHLRSMGLAERGLQALKKHLKEIDFAEVGDPKRGGALGLVSREERLPSIGLGIWSAFEHLYYRAVSGSDD